MWRFVFVLVLIGPTLAQDKTEVDKLLGMAQRAIARDRPTEALRHLHEALAHEPTSLPVLQELLKLHANEPDGRELWAHHLAHAGADERGRIADAPRAAKRALGLARTRAAAVQRLLGFAKRARSNADAPVLRFLADAVDTLAETNPSLLAAWAPEHEAALVRCAVDRGAVMAALEKTMQRVYREGKRAEAFVGARILRGLAVQAKRPGGRNVALGKHGIAAAAVMRAFRKNAEARTVLAVADLRAIKPADQPEWSRRHAEWSNPAVVRSPRGRYLVESVCGLRSTLVVATDLEHHHRRLAAWYGKDPFANVTGHVRVCRSQADLDPEDSPYWWAAGFQRGHSTTIFVNFQDREDLSGLLTHELAHRFDAALYPMLPGWLSEGRAVYAETTTPWPQAPTLDPRLVDYHRLWLAYADRYDLRTNFVKLIESKPDDYRDNYTAGYAVWLYLARFREKACGPRLEPYLKSFAAQPGMAAVVRFTQHFADGKDGRPNGFGALVAEFGRFLGEVNAVSETQSWIRGWRNDASEARLDALVAQHNYRAAADEGELTGRGDRHMYDKSNWPQGRRRYDDPHLGETHAYDAAVWLQRHGPRKIALAAFMWAFAVDEPGAPERNRIATALDEAKQRDGAWVLRRTGKPPAGIVRIQKSMKTMLEATEELATEYAEEGLPRAARAMRAERDALAAQLGLAPRFADEPSRPQGPDRPPPDCHTDVSVLAAGVTEERWSPGETIVKRRWHSPNPMLLVLGRHRAGPTISGLKRDAFVRDVFVRSNARYAGTYTFRTRVRALSAFLRGGIVLGHTRNDRGLVIRMEGGDYAYAIGLKKQGARFKNIRLRIDDLRPYDRKVSYMLDEVEFPTAKESFELEVRVSGPFVRVRVDGKFVLSHRTATRLKIAGHVGFHLRAGLVAFDAPRVRRHRVLGRAATCPCESHDAALDFSKPCDLPWRTWDGRRVANIPPDPLGTVLLCFGKAHQDGWRNDDDARDTVLSWTRALGDAARLRILHPVGKPSVPWGGVLAAGRLHEHHGFAPSEAALEKWVEGEIERRVKTKGSLTKKQATEDVRDELRSQPIWLALDPDGVVRAAGFWFRRWPAMPAEHLIRLLRGY